MKRPFEGSLPRLLALPRHLTEGRDLAARGLAPGRALLRRRELAEAVRKVGLVDDAVAVEDGAGLPAPFQAFTAKFSGRADRIITAVSVSQAFDPRKPPTPLPRESNTTALWDTGASKSVISVDLAKSLALVPVGKAQVNHAAGSVLSPTHLVNFKLPNQVGIAGALVTEFSKSLAGGFDAIVGMDIITIGDLSITNVAGTTWVSFRTLSCVAIDYVAEANRLRFAGVGRNDPCPCGKTDPKGKRVKFKRCHGLSL